MASGANGHGTSRQALHGITLILQEIHDLRADGLEDRKRADEDRKRADEDRKRADEDRKRADENLQRIVADAAEDRRRFAAEAREDRRQIRELLRRTRFIANQIRGAQKDHSRLLESLVRGQAVHLVVLREIAHAVKAPRNGHGGGNGRPRGNGAGSGK